MNFIVSLLVYGFYLLYKESESGSRFKVQGSRFRVQGSGFRVQGSGFRVQGSRFREMRNEGGGFAANIYGAIREKRCRTPFRILAFKIQGNVE
jgi:hypothetical protein